ncbi:MAG: type toxin-antitoxin system VapC family toxin [Segetibacter sp.]|jgi:tRNA(fMet)-specific endonuclease VapC|nr:type toxin-antitoxin system VapC family toxin [Segetibacter sp.]
MADKIILTDTSILIDYFRKTDKDNSVLISLFDRGFDFTISAITHYEIYSGTTGNQVEFWKSLLQRTKVLGLDEIVAQTAVDINKELKRKRKQIEIADLFIAATAVANNLPFATLNRKHFDRIDNLNVVE